MSLMRDEHRRADIWLRQPETHKVTLTSERVLSRFLSQSRLGTITFEQTVLTVKLFFFFSGTKTFHLTSVLSALASIYYIPLLMSGRSVIRMDKFLPQHVGVFEAHRDLMLVSWRSSWVFSDISATPDLLCVYFSPLTSEGEKPSDRWFERGVKESISAWHLWTEEAANDITYHPPTM